MDETIKETAEQFYGGYCELEDRDGSDWAEAVSNAEQVRQIFIKHLREVVEGAGLTDEEIQKVFTLNGSANKWVMGYMKVAAKAQLQAILNLKALEEK